MKHIGIISNLIIYMVVSLFFTACGSGDSGQEFVSASATSTIITGRFLDGPVEGVDYECRSGRAGVTNADGEFSCEAGDDVTFRVGSVVLGTTEVQEVVTPLTLYPDDPAAAVNVARLLQTLDDDGDLNRFVIDRTKAESLDEQVDPASSEFEREVKRCLGQDLIDEEKAIEHMRKYVELPNEMKENISELIEKQDNKNVSFGQINDLSSNENENIEKVSDRPLEKTVKNIENILEKEKKQNSFHTSEKKETELDDRRDRVTVQKIPIQKEEVTYIEPGEIEEKVVTEEPLSESKGDSVSKESLETDEEEKVVSTEEPKEAVSKERVNSKGGEYDAEMGETEAEMPNLTCAHGEAVVEGRVRALVSSEHEMLNNGRFVNAKYWVIKDRSWSIHHGKAYCDGSQSKTVYIYQDAHLERAKEYKVIIHVTSLKSGTLKVSIGGYESSSAIDHPGVHVFKLKAMHPKQNGRLYIIGDRNFKGSVDSISVVSGGISRKGVSGVRVSMGGCETRTDANGVFHLADVSEHDRAVVRFSKRGYVEGSFVTKVEEGVPNYIEYDLEPVGVKKSVEEALELRLSEDGAEVIISEEMKEETEGEMTYLDSFSEEGKRNFPGTFKGRNGNGELVLFTSYGFINFGLRSGENDIKELSGEAMIKFPSISGLDAETIPLWYYDYTRGEWIEEGYAVRQQDGGYRGVVSHSGSWSLGVPVEKAPGVYRGRIVYEDGTPAAFLRVYAIGENWVSEDLSTDEEGYFEIEVVPESDFRLKAYDYRYKFGAAFTDIISGIKSGEVFEDKR